MVQGGSRARQPGFFRKHPFHNCRLPWRALATTGSRSRRGAIEIVIPGACPDMLHAITSGDFHGQTGPSSRMTNGNSSMSGPVLYVTGLTKSYRTAGETVAVLRGVNLAIAAGESVALTGESGSGKSTLLHLIAGLDAADGGEITLADVALSGLSDSGRAELRRDRLGLVFQHFGRGQSQIPVAHRRPARCGLARRTGRAARAWRSHQTLPGAIVRRPAAA